MTYVRTLCYLTLWIPYSCIFNSCKAVVLSRNAQDVSFTGINKYSTKADGPPWRIIYFGTDNFSFTCIQPVCAKLRTGTLISKLSVVSRPGSVVRKFAEEENLTVYDWPLDHNLIKDKYDLGIVVSFGHLIPERIINVIPLGIFNVHGSLLPKWRGAAPIVHAVKNGDTETGVTVMRIKPKRFDTGDIIRQYRCSIGPNEMAIDLTDRLAKHGARLIMECIRDTPRCFENATVQSEDGVTLAPRVNASLAAVNWTTMDAKAVYNLHRAISHLYPLSCYWHGAQLRLFDVKPYQNIKSSSIDSENVLTSNKSALDFLNNASSNKIPIESVKNKDIQPGRIKWNPTTKILRIQCSDGNYVSCTGLGFVGKKKMSTSDFYNGYLSKRKETEWILT